MYNRGFPVHRLKLRHSLSISHPPPHAIIIHSHLPMLLPLVVLLDNILRRVSRVVLVLVGYGNCAHQYTMSHFSLAGQDRIGSWYVGGRTVCKNGGEGVDAVCDDQACASVCQLSMSSVLSPRSLHILSHSIAFLICFPHPSKLALSPSHVVDSPAV